MCQEVQHKMQVDKASKAKLNKLQNTVIVSVTQSLCLFITLPLLKEQSSRVA